MSERIDIRIYANRNTRGLPERNGDLRNEIDFDIRLAIKAVDTVFKSETDFSGGFADAREHDRVGIAAGCQHPVQFAAGDDIEAGALGRKRG